jgi:hypothetical protein
MKFEIPAKKVQKCLSLRQLGDILCDPPRLIFSKQHTFGLSDRLRLNGHRCPRLVKRVVLLFYGGEVRKCEFRAALSISVCFPPYPQEPCRPDPV